MKPGETTRPCASTVFSAATPARSPSSEILPSLMPTSARRAGCPEPSATRPPRMMKSSTASAPLPSRDRADRHRSEALAAHPRRLALERIEAVRDPADEVAGQWAAGPADRRVSLIDEAHDQEVPDVPGPLGLHEDGGLVVNEEIADRLVDGLVLFLELMLMGLVDNEEDLAAALHAVHRLALQGQDALEPLGGVRRTGLIQLRDRFGAAELDPYLGHDSSLLTTSFCSPL